MAGLTLVELIVAMTLTAMVAGGTAVMLRSVTGPRGRAERQMAVQQEARSAVAAVAAALRNAHRGGGEDWALEGRTGWLDGRPADAIRFFTVSGRAVRPGEPEGDVRECEFFLARVEGRRWPTLMRRTDPTRNGPADGGGVVEPVADNVVALALAYHDGARWQDRWPRTSRQWPAAVRVWLTAVDDPDGEVVCPAGVTVDFPYWAEAKAESEPGKTSEPEKPAGSEKPAPERPE